MRFLTKMAVQHVVIDNIIMKVLISFYIEFLIFLIKYRKRNFMEKLVPSQSNAFTIIVLQENAGDFFQKIIKNKKFKPTKVFQQNIIISYRKC